MPESFFSFLYRILMGTAAFVLALAPVMLIGALTAWTTNSVVIVVEGAVMAVTIFVAEHLRLAVYGRYASSRDVVVYELEWPDSGPEDAILQPPSVVYESVKRAVDVAASLLGLFLLAPVFLAVAAMVKLDSPGPLLVSGLRIGKAHRRFRLWRFRTTYSDVEDLANRDRELYALFRLHDPRFTRVGAFLRRTSIDELPQLINVLRGEMSLVGPRPVLPEEVNEVPLLLLVQPGITGLWAVSGHNVASLYDQRRLEEQYVRRRSLWLDLKILLMTIPAALRSGSY
jgi:lipopolysaccharide/colanic/teichoic acid biosynthesis glycosyltransferase